jgi:coenzyme F420-reducing hydrogenase alpha subunit
MGTEKKIEVDYITRVEGQGSLNIGISGDGEIEELKFSIFEPPKFFEAFLVGRKFYEIMELTSRICGICPVTHQITALKAVENALDLDSSRQTRDLRKLLAMSGHISSHVLSLYFLSLPDFLGYRSVIEMAKDHLGLLKRGFRLKKLGNDLTELIGGRSVHPVTAVLRGFTRIPSRDEMQSMKKQLCDAKNDALETIDMFAEIEVPLFIRKCEHLALSNPDEYAINEGLLTSTEGLNIAPREYRNFVEEKQVRHSTAKHSTVKSRKSYLVGPLARVNLNFNNLSRDAKKSAQSVGFTYPSFNPFHSHLARAIEVVSHIDESIEIIDGLSYREEDLSVSAKSGEGYAITEAPRGINYHNYRFNKNGVVQKAEIVPPTCQNAKNIEMDLWQFVPKMLDLPNNEVTRLCEMLIRAYDPCISCSVHSLKLNIHKTNS